MTTRCQCGGDNPDDAKFCNKCGKELVLQKGDSHCPKCGHVNPEHVAFCGRCGADLDAGFAKHVATEMVEEPEIGDAYVRWGNSRSLFIWGGTYSQTVRQYLFGLVVSSVLLVVISIYLAVATHNYLIPAIILACWAVGTYFWWWVGREGAGG